jgi:hypothetical protein
MTSTINSMRVRLFGLALSASALLCVWLPTIAEAGWKHP